MTHTAHPQHRTPNPSPRLAFWTSPTGITCITLIMLATLATAILLIRALATPASEHLKVQITDCRAGGTINLASTGLEVTNTGTTTRTARIGIEYRDATGALLDTDTARVPAIAPGGTVRITESTVLSGRAQGQVRCAVTSVR